MIVILLKDVKGTGKSGDVVKVSDGYARNMLIPKGMAKEATEGNVRSLEKQKALAKQKIEEDKEAAKELAIEIEKATIEIFTKGGEGGRLFGSITSKDIGEALKEQAGIMVDKKKIQLDSPIKTTGEQLVPVKLYGDVSAQIRVKVSAQ